MRYISRTRPFYATRINARLLLSAATILLVTSCVNYKASRELDERSSKYTTDSLAKDWREQVRNNPKNPYEGGNYPSDNDSEYLPPKKGNRNTPNNNTGIPPYDNDDSNYGKFPRYNPDDDNMPVDPKNYPLYY